MLAEFAGVFYLMLLYFEFAFIHSPRATILLDLGWVDGFQSLKYICWFKFCSSRYALQLFSHLLQCNISAVLSSGWNSSNIFIWIFMSNVFSLSQYHNPIITIHIAA